MESLRFPWDDDSRREVAPSAFRPRKSRPTLTGRSQVSRPPSRHTDDRTRRPGVSGPPRPAKPSPPATRSGNTSREASRHANRDRAAGRVVQGPQRERHEPDYLLMVAAVALTAIGILMVYSSGGYEAVAIDGGTVFDAIADQLGWALFGGLVLVAAMRIDYRYWRSFSILGIVVALVLLVLVIGPHIPPLLEPLTINGATRWLRVGGLPSFQPSEFAKIALIIFAAHWLTTRGKEVGSFRRGLLPFTLIVGLMAALIVVEPDLGGTGVVVLTAFSMFYVAGGSLWKMLTLAPVGAAAVAGFVMLKPYMLERIQIWQDPFKYASDEGYQTVQGLKALALGGVAGQGLGVSQQPTGMRIPAAENDYIFAVLGQELGLVGGMVVIGLFLLLAWRGVRVAMNAPDTFGGLLALGITSWLTFQALINIAVVVSLIPMSGMPLPFVSKGGTSLVVVLAAVGILLSISRETTSRGDNAHEVTRSRRGARAATSIPRWPW